MLILNAEEVRAALPLRNAISAMQEAFAALSAGQAQVPPRAQVPLAGEAALLLMPAALESAAPALAVKVVSLFGGNRLRGLAPIQAAVLVLDPETGQTLALLEGATLTAIRTAAASALATDLLSRPESRVLALFGAGAQARWHARALGGVRPLEEIRVYSRTPAAVAALLRELEGDPEVTARLVAAASPAAAVRGADLVCCATNAREPVFMDADLAPGTHVNAVGAFQPQAREVPPETVARAAVFVDSRAAAWEEAGDLIQPRDAGLISPAHILAELGELVSGAHPGRTHPEQITLFKSVGVAVQDAAAAREAVAHARRLGLGTEVAW